MKFKHHLCPKCFEVPVSILTSIFSNCLLRDTKEGEKGGPKFEYAGQSDVCWDTEEPVLEGVNVTLTCTNHHEWKSETYE